MKDQFDTPMTFDKFDFDKFDVVDTMAGDIGARDVEAGVNRDNLRLQVDANEELEWLISLALDDALDAAEAARLEWLLQQSSESRDHLERWQMVDSDLHHIPAALPPLDFAEKFALRLEIHERQRRLRTGFIFGLAAVALWGSALVGLGMLGALVWSNQGTWLAEVVHGTAYWWAAMGQFVTTLFGTAETLWAAPQTRTVLAVYLVAAVAILAGWFVFLRRSTRELPLGEAHMVEA